MCLVRATRARKTAKDLRALLARHLLGPCPAAISLANFWWLGTAGQSAMATTHPFSQLVQQAKELVCEIEALQSQPIPDNLIVIGHRLRDALLRAEQFLDASYRQVEGAMRMCAEISELRKRIQQVLDAAKGSLAPDEVEPERDEAYHRSMPDEK